MENNKDENSCRYLTSLKFILLKNNFDFRFPKKIITTTQKVRTWPPNNKESEVEGVAIGTGVDGEEGFNEEEKKGSVDELVEDWLSEEQKEDILYKLYNKMRYFEK